MKRFGFNGAFSVATCGLFVLVLAYCNDAPTAPTPQDSRPFTLRKNALCEQLQTDQLTLLDRGSARQASYLDYPVYSIIPNLGFWAGDCLGGGGPAEWNPDWYDGPHLGLIAGHEDEGLMWICGSDKCGATSTYTSAQKQNLLNILQAHVTNECYNQVVEGFSNLLNRDRVLSTKFIVGNEKARTFIDGDRPERGSTTSVYISEAGYTSDEDLAVTMMHEVFHYIYAVGDEPMYIPGIGIYAPQGLPEYYAHLCFQ